MSAKKSQEIITKNKTDYSISECDSSPDDESRLIKSFADKGFSLNAANAKILWMQYSANRQDEWKSFVWCDMERFSDEDLFALCKKFAAVKGSWKRVLLRAASKLLKQMSQAK